MHTPDALWGLPDPHSQAEFYADVPTKRAIAWVIDTILILAIVILLSLMTVGIGFFFFGFLLLAVGFVYRTVTIANSSATPGMRMTAIEFRNHRGERLDLTTAVLHTLGFSVSMAMVLPQIASIILMLTTPRGQGLSDMVLGTAAVNRNARS
ncbi:RDD family protein [Maritimibacter fusiformis]|uniref:RDD family protein n=1 Tax=Maritimibacter fusiformis TaxID=2603819 RepID=A0A5D0RPH7_9RHOB|nr:RDD family protein [Maritimibacter fusiformis]TYB83497.1 RDD family protein [Maritimibacter fusiformis]